MGIIKLFIYHNNMSIQKTQYWTVWNRAGLKKKIVVPENLRTFHCSAILLTNLLEVTTAKVPIE